MISQISIMNINIKIEFLKDKLYCQFNELACNEHLDVQKGKIS